jgi:AcrR family transcriptional regulator
MSTIRKNPADPATCAALAPRRRLLPSERERMIVDGSVRFFSEHGLDGQLRDLARGLGITHTLLYHYFPTKQALIGRVYSDLFEGRWRPEWESLLDDRTLAVETKLTRFYVDYARVILQRDWIRIFIFSGLSDRYITDRYFSMLEEKLFPRLVRESRKYRGQSQRGKPAARELELLMGLHGGIFYMGMRRWVYGHAVPDDSAPAFDETLIRDRVRGYLLSLDQVLGSTCNEGQAAAAAGAVPPRRKKPIAAARSPAPSSSPSLEEMLSWPMH